MKITMIIKWNHFDAFDNFVTTPLTNYIIKGFISPEEGIVSDRSVQGRRVIFVPK